MRTVVPFFLLASTLAAASCSQLVSTPQSRCTSDDALDTVARTLLYRSSPPSLTIYGPIHLTPSQEANLVAFLRSRFSRITLARHDDTTDQTICAGIIFDQPIRYTVDRALDQAGWVYAVEMTPELETWTALAVDGHVDDLRRADSSLAPEASQSPLNRTAPSPQSPAGASTSAQHHQQTTSSSHSLFPYWHNGPDATILSVSGIGSREVRLRAEVTSANVDNWCSRAQQPSGCWADGETGVFEIVADCAEGRMTWSPGNHYHQVIGQDDYGLVFEDVEGRLYASFNQDAAIKFEQLCPNAEFENLPILTEFEE